MSYDNVLAVIPCRKGSKRFPGKNTALFKDVPLIHNTIRIARQAWIEKILVTTDDYNVALIADRDDVVCMERSEYLCTDDARTEDAIENAVHYAMYAVDGPHWTFDTICLLQVTSPLLNQATLQIAIDKYFDERLTSLMSVNILYKPAGAFCIVDRELFMRNKSVYQKGGGVYMLPADQCIDVDYVYDLEIANVVASGRVFP